MSRRDYADGYLRVSAAPDPSGAPHNVRSPAVPVPNQRTAATASTMATATTMAHSDLRNLSQSRLIVSLRQITVLLKPPHSTCEEFALQQRMAGTHPFGPHHHLVSGQPIPARLATHQRTMFHINTTRNQNLLSLIPRFPLQCIQHRLRTTCFL